MIRKQHARNITLKGHFAPIPNELCQRKDLSVQARLIWIYLMSEDPNWASSRNNIARNLGIDRTIITRAIRELERAQLVKVDRRPKKSLNFDLIDPENWAIQSPRRMQTGRSSRPHLGDPVAHIQEYKNKDPKNGFQVRSAAGGREPARPPFYGGGRQARTLAEDQERANQVWNRIQREKEQSCGNLTKTDGKTRSIGELIGNVNRTISLLRDN